MLLNRKLIIAVLTIGLMISFSSAAIGYDETKEKPLTPVPSMNNNPTIDGATKVSLRNHSDIAKSMAEFAVEGQIAYPGDRHCQVMDPTFRSFTHYWTLPNIYGNTAFGNKFSVTQACTLNDVGVALYGALMEGTPDFEISVWSGNGSGYPVAKIATYTYLNASLPAAGAYFVNLDLTGEAGYPADFQFAEGDEFFVIGKPIINTPADIIRYLYRNDVDDEIEHCVTTYDEVTWYTMTEDFWGGWPPRVFTIYADVCYEEEDLEGTCALKYDYDGAYYLWDMVAADVNGMTHYGVEFSSALPETLKVIKLGFYDVWDDLGNSIDDPAPIPGGVFPDLRVDVCFDDGFGNPDIASPEASFILNAADVGWWTRIYVEDDYGLTLVHTGSFYVVVSVDGVHSNADYNGLEGFQFLGDLWDSDGGVAMGTSGLYADVVPGVWLSYTDAFDWVMQIETCTDLYSSCGVDQATGGFNFLWTLPTFLDDDGLDPPVEFYDYNTAIGTAFDPAFAGCDVDYADIYFYSVGTYAGDAEVAIYDNTGTDGLPGNRLFYAPIAGGDWGTVTGAFDFAGNVFFDSRIWVVVESFSATDDDLSMVSGDGTYNSGRSALLIDGAWMYMTDYYLGDYHMIVDLYRCCYPFIVRSCAPDGDWPTMGKNYARDYSTLNEVGDIQCNLTKAWTYKNYFNGNPTTPGNGVTFASPIIADGKVFAYMFNALVCVDVNTGAELWRRDVNYSEIGGSCRATPTYKDGVIYCGGGDNGYFSKFDAATGATLWAFAMNGHAQYAPHVIMDIDGTECVIVADGLGNIYGLQTSDGANYYHPGTTTAVYSVAGQIHKGFTTDGTYLYVGCDEYYTTPNVYRLAIDGSGITVDWDLASGIGWQLQNIIIDEGWTNDENSQEGCYATILYDDEGADGQWIYFVGQFAPQNSSPVHNGGILYKVSADGTTFGWASECNGGSGGSPSGIINDKATVIFGGWSNWNEGGEYYGPMAFSKKTGLPQWGPNDYQPNWNIQTIPDEWGHVNQAGVLTCETVADPGESDWLIFGNEFGYWNFADPTAGEVVWSRRSARFLTYVTGPVVDGSGHIIFGEGYNLHCLANDVPRPRLAITNMHPELPVPFGLPAGYTITFPGILANSGCADLEIFHVELLDVDNGTFPNRVSTVNSGRSEAISAIAKENSGLKIRAATMLDERAASLGFETITSSPAAFALPAYITSLTGPVDGTIIPAGGSADIVLEIDGTKVPRGASQFYAEIHSDDPDFFLDSAYMDYADDAADPTVLLTVIGGCLYTSMDFPYGNGGVNHIPVWNSTLIMESNSGNSSFDGETAYLYGMDGYCYSIDTERVVMHWFDGLGNATWESILPDPLPTCDFAVEEDAVLALLSDDGSAYSNVLGTIVNYAYVDSMEDHRVYTVDTTVVPWDTVITWEWDVEYNSGLNKPYSNELTEGWAFKALVTEYAVTDVTGPKYGFEDFWDFKIERHAVYSRYGTAIPGLFVGSIADWDVETYSENTTGYSEEFSVGWIYDPSSVGPDMGTGEPDFGGGLIKIPFGPGYMPMINTVDATTAWFGGEEPGFDSIYVWMSRPSTQFTNYTPYPVGTDRRMWNSITELNLPAWAFTGNEDDPVPDDAFETWGVAFFGKYTDHNAAAIDNYSDMAMLINKFCGFGRGDMNDDGAMNLVDIVYLNDFVHGDGLNGPFPFMHLGDVDNDGAVDNLDIIYMINWYFNGGPDPIGDWALPQFATPTP